MISLTCTHCQTVLSIDDAFAGGVCRCQHCGTIQTVPASLRKGATAKAGASAGPNSAAGKALYQSTRGAASTRSDETGSGTGLEDLADVVASSGLAGSGLSASVKPRKKSRRKSVDAPVSAPAPRSRTPLLIGGIALLVAVVAFSAWILFGSRSKPQQASPQQASPELTPQQVSPQQESPQQPDALVTPTPAPTIEGPAFCGIPLTGNSIVYLLDRGDSARELLDSMKEATYKSIQNLGPDRKFQVLLWDNNTSTAGYPASTTTFATPENVDACRKALEDVMAEHQSTINAPLTQAVTETPDSIVIVTAKGFELDDNFVSQVQGITKHSPIKLYTISLGTESSALETLAKNSGGVYKSLTEGALRAGSGG